MMHRWCLVVFVLAVLAPRIVLAHGETWNVGSMANGSGALVLDGYDFSEKIYVPPQTIGATQTLYTTQFPSFEFPTADQPGVPLYRLPDGTPLTLQIACDGPVCIDPGASVRTNVIADATGETCSLGTVEAESHFHPEWRLLLNNGVFGDYTLPFRITTTAPGYSPSQVYTLTLTNIAPVPPSPTPTATTEAATATPTETAPGESSPTPTATAPAGLCPATPVGGCRADADKSVLVVKRNSENPAKDLVLWKWLKGPAVDVSELGDPTATTAHALCIYDEVAGGFTRVIEAALPAGGDCGGVPCWKATAKGFKYKDKAGGNAIVNALLNGGGAGKSKVVVKGRGAALGVSLPVQQSTRVRVQLRSDGASCWESTFESPASKSSEIKFTDKDE
jgi:hypothetical protein